MELLRLRCRLFQGNAARCRGDFSEAHEDFELAMFVATELDIRELTFWAEAKSFWASWHRAKRDFPGATREARTSVSLYRAARAATEEAAATWKLATIREQAGDFSGALGYLREILPQALRLPFARLHLDLRHSEATYLARLGRFEEAAAIQYSLRDLYFARDGFVQKKTAYDAALVTLDWTLHLLDAGRPAEVVPLALSMGRAFEALGVARETLVSWSLLTEAAERLELGRAEAAAWVEVLDAERVVGRRR